MIKVVFNFFLTEDTSHKDDDDDDNNGQLLAIILGSIIGKIKLN